MFNDALMGADEERLKGVFVGDPVERNGKIYFKVRAFDDEGPFEIWRRFSDFETLRKVFTTRIGGLYIPRLPKSGFFGDSKDVKFLSERSFHLE
jgi:sorting nexin-1/2